VKLIGETAERDTSFLINNLTEYGESLLAMKEDLINPIKAFMNGTQRATYDSVTDFFKKQEVNIAELSADEQAPIKALIGSRTPYLGLVLRDAKAARDAAQIRIETLLTNARANAIKTIDSLEAGLKTVPEFSKLNDSQKQEVFGMSADIRLKLQGESFIPTAQQHVQTYKDRTYSLQLDRITKLATPTPDPTPGGRDPVPQPPLPTYVGFRDMMQGKDQALINDQAELEAWIQDFRERASAEIAKGKRIRLS
jgi:hypothetical protein